MHRNGRRFCIPGHLNDSFIRGSSGGKGRPISEWLPGLSLQPNRLFQFTKNSWGCECAANHTTNSPAQEHIPGHISCSLLIHKGILCHRGLDHSLGCKTFKHTLPCTCSKSLHSAGIHELGSCKAAVDLGSTQFHVLVYIRSQETYCLTNVSAHHTVGGSLESFLSHVQNLGAGQSWNDRACNKSCQLHTLRIIPVINPQIRINPTDEIHG